MAEESQIRRDEMDQLGQFTAVRKVTISVSPEHLISESKYKKSKIKLINFDDSEDTDESMDSLDESDDGVAGRGAAGVSGGGLGGGPGGIDGKRGLVSGSGEGANHVVGGGDAAAATTTAANTATTGIRSISGQGTSGEGDGSELQPGIKQEHSTNPVVSQVVPHSAGQVGAALNAVKVAVKRPADLHQPHAPAAKKIKLVKVLDEHSANEDNSDEDSELDYDKILLPEREDEFVDAVQSLPPSPEKPASTAPIPPAPIPPAPIPPAQVESSAAETSTISPVPAVPATAPPQFPENDINQGSEKLYKKLLNKEVYKPYEMDQKYNEVYRLLQSTIRNKESQSCLIVGPRSSGKTHCLNAVLQDFKNQIKSIKDEFITIRISGFSQDNERIALKSIAKQLDFEVSRIFNINLDELNQDELIHKKSITETFANILNILDKKVLKQDDSNGNKESRGIDTPIIFIVDEVENIADFNKQTLLYNLFDLVEASSTPISTICLSTKITVKDLFEKRVRSRFSQKMIQFRRFELDDFFKVSSSLLTFDEPVNEYETKWNEEVLSLINTKDTNLRKLILYNHLEINNLKELKNSFLFPISKICLKQPFLNDSDFNKYQNNVKKNSMKSIINLLSELELELIICCARVVIKNGVNQINLNMTYEEYKSQCRLRNKELNSNVFNKIISNTNYKIWEKENCKKPWEVLQNLNLLTLPMNVAKTGKLLEFTNGSFETKLWQTEITLDELKSILNNSSSIKNWTRL